MVETKAGQKVTIYEVKCSLCRQKIRGASERECKERLGNHIDNECKTAKMYRDWDKRGIYKEMIGFLQLSALDKDLKKLLKHYSIEEIKDAVERLGENTDC